MVSRGELVRRCCGGVSGNRYFNRTATVEGETSMRSMRWPSSKGLPMIASGYMGSRKFSIRKSSVRPSMTMPEISTRSIYVDAVDAVAKFKGPADDRVGVHGQQEILNQEVERAAVDDDAGDLDTLDIDRGAAGGRTDAGGNTDGALPVEEFGHQPSRLTAGGTFQLAEIDERGAAGQIAGGGAQLGVAHAGRRFPGGPGVEFREGEDDARAGTEALAFDGVHLLLGGGVFVV